MDEDWAGRLADDVDAAFEGFLRAHQDAVFTLARRLTNGSRADAEDVAQEAFVRAYRALTGYDAARIRELRLRPWLARITLNVQRNRVRRRRPVPGTGPEPVTPEHEGPAAVAEVRSAAAEVAAALDCLGDDVRTVVVLRHLAGLPYTEVAEAVGRPVGTVKAQVHRGLRRLRAELEDRHDQEDHR